VNEYISGLTSAPKVEIILQLQTQKIYRSK